jgi:hypothetical protein
MLHRAVLALVILQQRDAQLFGGLVADRVRMADALALDEFDGLLVHGRQRGRVNEDTHASSPFEDARCWDWAADDVMM